MPYEWESDDPIVPVDLAAALRTEYGVAVNQDNGVADDGWDEEGQEPEQLPLSPRIRVDPRVKRMIRVAIASYPAVILVGPPGTGKTSLLREVLEEVNSNHGAYGFSAPPGEPIRVTPDESWTARELVGGETIDAEGRLAFRPGHVLRAIAANKWLVLDEANRGDMDKIFGPILTWLSENAGSPPVDIGRLNTADNAPIVQLAWSDAEDCRVDEISSGEADGERYLTAVQYVAGKRWRLLASYNPLDVNRVFRFGLALARRFAEIPVPAPSPEAFRVVVRDAATGLPEQVPMTLAALYEAHRADTSTRLGPAIFLQAIPYVRAALALQGLLVTDQPNAGEDGAVEQIEARGPEHEAEADAERNQVTGEAADARQATPELLMQLLAEAYMTVAGKYLAKREEGELEQLWRRIENSNALPLGEWEWIVALLPDLA